MRALGMNTIYIAHNNPGTVEPDGFEPGICPAVWFALTRATDLRLDAAEMVQAAINSVTRFAM